MARDQNGARISSNDLRVCEGCRREHSDKHCGHNNHSGWWCSPECLLGKDVPEEFAHARGCAECAAAWPAEWDARAEKLVREFFAVNPSVGKFQAKVDATPDQPGFVLTIESKPYRAPKKPKKAQ